MTDDEIFDAWAPPGAPWSAWCKPVLFARIGDATLPIVDLPLESFVRSAALEGLPPRGERVALVVNLPGRESAALGLLLAGRTGHLPVPLFNGAPPPQALQAAQVDVLPIVDVLRRGAAVLRDLALAVDAPPAFLLDADRRVPTRPLQGEAFDNRSISFPTDFPSATRLAASGITRVLVIDESPTQPDLLRTLRRWQEGGIPIWRRDLSGDAGPRLVDVPRPSWLRRTFHRVFETMGLHRNVLGGFGGFPPQPGGGTG